MTQKSRRAANDNAGRGAARGAQAGEPIDGMFRAAVAHHQAGRLDPASAGYRQILAVNPRHADALHMLGVIALQRNDPESGITLIRQSLNSGGRNPRAQYNLGLALQAKGQRKDALAAFKRAVRIEPRFFEAHNNIGAILLDERGKLGEAAAALERALALKPGYAEAHNNLAVVLKRRGAFDRALAEADAALSADPKHLAAHNTRAMVLLELGRTDEAEASLRQALKIAPQDPSALNNLGLALKDRGAFDEAEVVFNQILEARPDDVDALNNLGVCLQRRSQLIEALDAFEQAAEVDPDDLGAQRNLGLLHLRLGDGLEALDHGRRALALDPDDPPTWQAYADALRLALSQSGDDGALWEDLGRCLAREGIDHARLSGAPWRQIRARPDAAGVLRAAREGRFTLSATDVARGAMVDALGGDVFLDLLRRYPVPEAELELFLETVRRSLLGLAIENRLPEDMERRSLGFVCALAEQCFLNGYVYRVEAEEAAQLEVLRERLVLRLQDDDALPRAALALYASYAPLATLAGIARLTDRDRPAEASPLGRLVARQVTEPGIEATLAASIRRDGPQRAPSPGSDKIPARWFQIPPEDPRPYASWLGGRFPDVSGFPNVEPEILVAGCGTGLQVAVQQQRFVGARVLAVDPDAAALGFAKRAIDARGVGAVDWVCAEPFAEVAPDRRFDLIVCPRSLSRASDPESALAVLRRRLRPGGVMLLGFESALGAAHILSARVAFREAYGHATAAFDPTADAVRRFRHEVFAAPEDAPYKEIITLREFYGLADCIDLLTVQTERRDSLREIEALLAGADLSFLGIETGDAGLIDKYREKHPEGTRATRLDLWAEFEQTQPKSFRGGYLLWARSEAG